MNPPRTHPTTIESLKYKARGFLGSIKGLWTLPLENTRICDDTGTFSARRNDARYPDGPSETKWDARGLRSNTATGSADCPSYRIAGWPPSTRPAGCCAFAAASIHRTSPTVSREIDRRTHRSYRQPSRSINVHTRLRWSDAQFREDQLDPVRRGYPAL